MVRFKATREFYIPRQSIKAADKASDAVAYLYERDGRLFAALFVGKQARPMWHFWFPSQAKREARVRQSFEARRVQLGAKVEQRAKRRAEGHHLAVGDILSSSWGYEQTNVDFYEVVAVSGCVVTIRELAQVRETTGWEQGTCLPQPGTYIGEPMRKRAQGDSVRVASYAHAKKWNTGEVAGVKTGPVERWTSYG